MHKTMIWVWIKNFIGSEPSLDTKIICLPQIQNGKEANIMFKLNGRLGRLPLNPSPSLQLMIQSHVQHMPKKMTYLLWRDGVDDTIYIKTQVFRLLRYYSPATRNVARSDWATQNITHNMTSSIIQPYAAHSPKLCFIHEKGNFCYALHKPHDQKELQGITHHYILYSIHLFIYFI